MEAAKDFIIDDGEAWDMLNKMSLSVNESESEKEKCMKCVNPICEGSSEDIIQMMGDVYCVICFTLQERMIDMTAEWRFYGHDDNKLVNPTRCGLATNTLFPGSSLSSFISMDNNSFVMQQIRKYHMWNSMPYRERSLYNVTDLINTKATNCGILPSVIEDAKNMFKQISEEKISRGDNRQGLIASSIYMSCRKHNTPRSAKEIANMFNLSREVMTKGCKRFHEIMRYDMKTTTAEHFVRRFCSNLNCSDIEEICIHIIDRVNELEIIQESSPPSITSSIIYMICMYMDKNISKKEISISCEISEVTISKCYKKLHEYRGVILPSDFIFKYTIM